MIHKYVFIICEITHYPQIPWAKIISMRNRLIHGYDFVDYDILWDAVTINIPVLLVELEQILPPSD